MAPPLEHDLPLISVTRVAKKALPDKAGLSKEAKETIQSAAAVFILYLTSAANEECKAKKRQTISVKDVLKALQDVDFDAFVPQVESFIASSKVEKKNSSTNEDGKADKAIIPEDEEEETKEN